MKKAELNYWVDLGIGIAFLVSAISGLIFLIPIDFTTGTTPKVLWISLSVWDTLHTWGSIALIAGVMAHMVLHWKWFTSMTRRTLLPGNKKPIGTRQPAGKRALSRRQFLYFASGAAAATLVGGLLTRQDASASTELANTTELSPDQLPGSQQAASFDEPSSTGTTLSTGTTQTAVTSDPTATPPPEVVATPTAAVLAVPVAEPTATATPVQTQQLTAPVCNRGCSYPGHCRRYTDQNGNGICDLTEWT